MGLIYKVRYGLFAGCLAWFCALAEGSWDIGGLRDSRRRLSTAEWTRNTRCMDLVDGDRLLFVHARRTRNVVVFELLDPGNLFSARFLYAFDTGPYLGSGDHPVSVGHGVFLRRPALDRMWLWNRTELWEFTLEKAGDLRTAGISAYRSFADRVSRGHAIHFHPEGKWFYVEDRDQERVHQFSLSTPWEIESAEPAGSLDLSARHEAVRGIEFNPDGTRMFLLDTGLREVQQYRLERPWDVTSAELEKAAALNIRNPRGMTWNEEGTRLYIMDATSRVAIEFHVGTP
jgi:hypothetical protein